MTKIRVLTYFTAFLSPTEKAIGYVRRIGGVRPGKFVVKKERLLVNMDVEDWLEIFVFSHPATRPVHKTP